MDSKGVDIKSDKKDRKLVVRDVGTMSRILGFLDNNEMSVIILYRIIIDFGYFKYAKMLLEKYYSELSSNRFLYKKIHTLYKKNILENITISGSYLLKIMGLIKENNDIDIFCHSDLDIKIKPEENSHKMKTFNDRFEMLTSSNYRNHTGIRYIYTFSASDGDLGNRIKQYTYQIIMMNNDIKNIKDHIRDNFDFDLCTNTLEYFENGSIKFSFGVGLNVLVSKQIDIININSFKEYPRNIKCRERIMKYIDRGFHFHKCQLLFMDEFSNMFKIIDSTNGNIGNLQKVLPVNLYQALNGDFDEKSLQNWTSSVQEYYNGTKDIKLYEDQLYSLKIERTEAKDYNNWKILTKYTIDYARFADCQTGVEHRQNNETISVLCKAGYAIKIFLYGKYVLFIKNKKSNNDNKNKNNNSIFNLVVAN